eukprot:12005510-Heterocapsa_arctica.AAC.1
MTYWGRLLVVHLTPPKVPFGKPHFHRGAREDRGIQTGNQAQAARDLAGWKRANASNATQRRPGTASAALFARPRLCATCVLYA